MTCIAQALEPLCKSRAARIKADYTQKLQVNKGYLRSQRKTHVATAWSSVESGQNKVGWSLTKSGLIAAFKPVNSAT